MSDGFSPVAVVMISTFLSNYKPILPRTTGLNRQRDENVLHGVSRLFVLPHPLRAGTTAT